MSWVPPRVGDVARGSRTDEDRRSHLRPWAALPLAGPGVDRAAERRSEVGLLDHLLHDPATRVLAVREGRFRVSDAGALVLRPPEPDDATRLSVFLGEGEFPGSDGKAAYVGVVDPTAPADDWAGVRSVATTLATADASLVATLTALANWHAAHGFCPRCGAATEPAHAGWLRRCVADDSPHFPRTDPAVIMTVVDDDDRLLLARGRGFTTAGMSVLAGFVEPGESLAAAVAREVHEEVGLSVDQVEYLGDQPWPFPSSLMVGFRAHATSTALSLQDDEIESARWFTRAELVADLEAGVLAISGRLSIARRLIEEWFGGQIAAPEATLRR